MPHRRSTKVYRVLLARAPRIMITDPWQVMGASMWLGLGLATLVALLFPDVTTAADRALYTTVARVLWSVSLIGGGGLQLVSLHFRERLKGHAARIERLGIGLSIIGTVIYGLALLAAGTPAAFILAVVFGIATICMGGVLLLGVIARRLGGL